MHLLLSCVQVRLVWGFGVLFLPCVCVSVSGVLFSGSLSVCLCDLLIFLQVTAMALRQYREELSSRPEQPPAAYIVESILCCGAAPIYIDAYEQALVPL